MAYLITGGAGFIGCHLAEYLAKEGKKVIVYDNLSIGTHNLSVLNKYKNIDVIKGDIRDLDQIKDVVKESEYIFHLAAMNRAPRSIENPLLSHEINVTGTLNILEASRLHDVKKVVFASSSSVYGGSEEFPRFENGEVKPTHPYAVGKLSSEYYCDVYNQLYGTDVKILRYFAVYGPRQSPLVEYAAVIPKFINNIIQDEVITIYGNGEQSRNFTFVLDNVKATITAMKNNNFSGEIFNIASEEEVSINKLVRLLSDITGKKSKIKYEKPRVGDPMRAPPDLSKTRDKFNFVPTTRIEEGLKMTINWFYKNRDYFK